MRAESAWFLALVPLLVAQPAPTEQAQKDRQRLQGTWEMAALEVNGKDVGVQKVQGSTLTIKGDRYSVRVKDTDRGCVIRLDPTQDPPAIDMVFKEPGDAEKTYKGIYQIDGDVLRICRGLNADQQRPVQFGTWPDTDYFLVTWRRKAP